MKREFKTLRLGVPSPGVLEVTLYRPKSRNAISYEMWTEVGELFSREVKNDPTVRCVLLTGAGKHFSSGIDLASAMGTGPLAAIAGGGERKDPFRVARGIVREGASWQRAWSSLSECGKPIVACVQGGCFGAALELIASADIRFCSADAYFVAPEVDLGLAADIGGLQRLPKVLGSDSLLRELMLSGRRMLAKEAGQVGLCSRVLESREELRKASLELCATIASKSPVATLGIKTLLNYSREHNIQESLDFAILWNSAALQADDVKEAGMAFMQKRTPSFANVDGGDSKLEIPESKL